MKTKIWGLIVGAILAWPAHATITVTILQVGSDVVMTGSGTANLASFGAPGNQTVAAFASPDAGWFLVGPVAAAALHIYQLPTSAPIFGPGGTAHPSSGAGDSFGIIGASSLLSVPSTYVSGAQLAGTSTFAGQTLAGMGMIIGTYVTHWGSGANARLLDLASGYALGTGTCHSRSSGRRDKATGQTQKEDREPAVAKNVTPETLPPEEIWILEEVFPNVGSVLRLVSRADPLAGEAVPVLEGIELNCHDNDSDSSP